jgi:hypothetical protein
MVAVLFAGLSHPAMAQAPVGDARPAIGDVASLPDALLVYAARGAAGACGENCSSWIAAEGALYWDSYKRVIAALDRLAGLKGPFILNVRGRSDLRAALSIGKVIRERGFDTRVGQTLVDSCGTRNEADCVGLKRAGVPVQASLRPLLVCDTACALVLAGGVRRSMPVETTVVIQGTQVGHRLGLNVPEEVRGGVHARSSEQIKHYLTQMGVEREFADLIDANYATTRQTVLSRADLIRLRVLTPQ